MKTIRLVYDTVRFQDLLINQSRDVIGIMSDEDLIALPHTAYILYGEKTQDYGGLSPFGFAIDGSDIVGRVDLLDGFGNSRIGHGCLNVSTA